MSAAVTDAGQGVVFRHEGDSRLAAAVRGAERRFDLTDAALDGKALSLQKVREHGGRLVLLERDLGRGVDPQRKVDQLLLSPFDLVRCPLFD